MRYSSSGITHWLNPQASKEGIVMYILVLSILFVIAVGWFMFRMVRNDQERREDADLQSEQEWTDEDSVEIDEDDR